MRLFRLLDFCRGKGLARPKQYRGAKGIGIIMNSKLKNADTDFLFDCVLSLKTREECYDFFEDLCTVTELKAISQRIVVAKMLSDDRVPQPQLVELTVLFNSAATDTKKSLSASKKKTNKYELRLFCGIL